MIEDYENFTIISATPIDLHRDIIKTDEEFVKDAIIEISKKHLKHYNEYKKLKMDEFKDKLDR